MNRFGPSLGQGLVGIGVFVVGAVMAAGAFMIPSEAGYAGVGPNFLPWLVSVMLMICGAWVLWEARTGGYRNIEQPSGSERGYWHGFAWVSAGLLANAALITTIGFILSCALCFVLAVRGLRSADAQGGQATSTGTVGQIVKDLCIGFAIAAPVYWMFTKLLAINLPGLTSSGWI
ncbi:MAG TPA: tripartite tricarboxylate transporter TctB family protein [Burkholderiaceae bacterium]|nr:tripartite tricarboxylate transporter TctB family protein [Burkholderiaceae bacterium]